MSRYWRPGQQAYTGLIIGGGILIAAVSLKMSLLLPLAIPLLGWGCLGLYPPPEPGKLEITREIDPQTVTPEVPVTITLRVTNPTESQYVNLRVVEDTEGTVLDTNYGGFVTLGPEETREITHESVVPLGTHHLSDAVVKAGNPWMGAVASHRIDVSGDSYIECDPTVATQSVLTDTIETGQTDAESGGSGIEFHSTKKYSQGDALTQIDWHSYARTNELSTIRYRSRNRKLATVILDLTIGGLYERPLGEEERHPAQYNVSEEGMDIYLYALLNRVITTYTAGYSPTIRIIHGSTSGLQVTSLESLQVQDAVSTLPDLLTAIVEGGHNQYKTEPIASVHAYVQKQHRNMELVEYITTPVCEKEVEQYSSFPEVQISVATRSETATEKQPELESQFQQQALEAGHTQLVIQGHRHAQLLEIDVGGRDV